jgi:hypothetical protein
MGCMPHATPHVADTLTVTVTVTLTNAAHKCSPQLCQHTESDCHGNLLCFHSWSRQATRHCKHKSSHEPSYPETWKITTSIENVARALKRVQRMDISMQFLENWNSNTRASLESLNTFTSSWAKTRHPNAQVLQKSTCAMHCQCDHQIARDRAISQFWEEGDQIYLLVIAFAFQW